MIERLIPDSWRTDPHEELDDNPLDQDVQETIEQQQNEINELRDELQKKEQDESARTAMLEERIQEKEQRLQELKGDLQEQSQRLQDVQSNQSKSSTSTPPPDDEVIKGLPVISADGNKNFGAFKGWISERDKIGIKCDHPRRDNKIEKVGWAESIRDLVFDAGSLQNKEAIIVKLDAQGNKVDYVNIHRHREVLQKKEKFEDQKQRLSGEVDELIKQNRKLERLNQKLIVSSNINEMEGTQADGSMELAMNKAMSERELDKQRIENLVEKNNAKRGQAEELIHEYEDSRSQEMRRRTTDDVEQSIEDTGDMLANIVNAFGGSLEDLDPELREDLLRALGGNSGGAINFKEE